PHKYNTYNAKITKLDKKSPLNKGLFVYAIHSSVKLPGQYFSTFSLLSNSNKEGKAYSYQKPEKNCRFKCGRITSDCTFQAGKLQ
ncbi:hypothetical protein, partial [Holdemania massiliensis]|uniref:hypothetical protein n=1 Tax=Holdemania massiliensis TaxID=1468449 RepID=UPI0019D541BC